MGFVSSALGAPFGHRKRLARPYRRGERRTCRCALLAKGPCSAGGFLFTDMKRRLLFICLLALLSGAVVNVAVTCLCVAQLTPWAFNRGLTPLVPRISAVSERDRLRWAKVAPVPVQFKVGTEKLVQGGFGLKVQHAPGSGREVRVAVADSVAQRLPRTLDHSRCVLALVATFS